MFAYWRGYLDRSPFILVVALFGLLFAAEFADLASPHLLT